MGISVLQETAFVGHFREGHQLEPRRIFKGQKVGGKASSGIAVKPIPFPFEIPFKEGGAFFQVFDIECNVFDFYVIHLFLMIQSALFVRAIRA